LVLTMETVTSFTILSRTALILGLKNKILHNVQLGAGGIFV